MKEHWVHCSENKRHEHESLLKVLRIKALLIAPLVVLPVPLCPTLSHLELGEGLSGSRSFGVIHGLHSPAQKNLCAGVSLGRFALFRARNVTHIVPTVCQRRRLGRLGLEELVLEG